MKTYWTLTTHGDPLAAIQQFLGTLWAEAGLGGMLVPAKGGEAPVTHPRLIEDARLLKEINPFKPLMTVNMASVVPHMLETHPDRRLGALLRPCEMRALIEVSKREALPMDRLLTVCVDCLGTYPAEEYEWRVARKKSADQLSQETLQFARQGGIAAYRYRPACQMCASPGAHGADVNIHVLGLPVCQQVLVHAEAANAAMRLNLAGITDGVASEALRQQHEHALAQMAERRRRTMEHITNGLGDLLPRDVDALIVQLENCGDCQRCMQACPICSVDLPRRSAEGPYARESIIHWLVSCAGCGMCEQACENRLPTAAIFGYIREKLDEELGYAAGHSLDEPLPWI